MLLSVNQLTKTYKEHVAVDGLTFSVNENECVALIGPNGSGKTTTLNMLAGLLEPTSGEVVFMGKQGVDKQKIGYLPQYPTFFSWMTAKEYLSFAGKLSHVPSKKLKSLVDDMLEFVGLQEVKNKRIGGFSGGMKQRLGIAQALLHEPKLLIFDEPVSALDPQGRRDVLQMMQQLKKKLTIVFSTHVLHDAEQICDRTIMIKNGKVKWAGSLEDLKNQQRKSNYFIAANQNLKSWLRTKPYIKDFQLCTDTSAEITLVNDNDRFQLLQDCVRDKLDVIHFEKRTHSLEDAYLEVMSQ